MCALAEGNLMPGASSQCEAGWPNSAGRYDGRGVDHGSPAELSRATRLSRPARLVSDQRHFVALLYTLSRDTTYFQARLAFPMAAFNVLVQWHGLQPYASGFVPLSIAEFSL